MTGLLDAVNEKANITIIISDNESISMTGGQESSALGHLESICRGIGVEPEHIRVLLPVPKNHDELCKIIRDEIQGCIRDHPEKSLYPESCKRR